MAKPSPQEISRRTEICKQIFAEVNAKHFDGFLPELSVRINFRIRSSAGRFIPGSRRWLQERPPVIEVADYLFHESNAMELVRDTIAHEMIHYWLWERRRPYGHTPEFYDKMTLIGATRYNPVPRTRPYKWAYRCPGCLKEFYSRRRLKPLACGNCCKEHAEGRFDLRFKLVLHRELSPREATELLSKN